MAEANQSFDARRMAREQESRMAATASMGLNVAQRRLNGTWAGRPQRNIGRQDRRSLLEKSSLIAQRFAACAEPLDVRPNHAADSAVVPA